MPLVNKNIVICCDGTGQSYAGAESNVLCLFRAIVNQPPYQIACYEPGIGTRPDAKSQTPVGRAIRRTATNAFGWGLIDNVEELYAYLMHNYEPGDRIFLFGFSRGAFIVRALAGIVHLCGLLDRRDAHLLTYAAGLYQTSERRIKQELVRRGRTRLESTGPGPIDHAMFDHEAQRFKTLFARQCNITFLGIWDTVKAFGQLWPRSYPALRHNPSVLAVRHAVSIDERRSFFQVTGWGDAHDEVKEVWFAGDHSDVGGGHEDKHRALADITLAWMVGEAAGHGLLLDCSERLAIERAGSTAAAMASAEPVHNLRRGWSWLLDWCPRVELNNYSYPPRRPIKFWPTGSRQPQHHMLRSHVRLHSSVRARRIDKSADYHPMNLQGFSDDMIVYEDGPALINQNVLDNPPNLPNLGG
jgi:uncharacterized protein (DUF2235 family)